MRLTDITEPFELKVPFLSQWHTVRYSPRAERKATLWLWGQLERDLDPFEVTLMVAAYERGQADVHAIHALAEPVKGPRYQAGDWTMRSYEAFVLDQNASTGDDTALHRAYRRGFGHGSAFAAGKCQPTLTECPTCKNDVSKCVGVLATNDRADTLLEAARSALSILCHLDEPVDPERIRDCINDLSTQIAIADVPVRPAPIERFSLDRGKLIPDVDGPLMRYSDHVKAQGGKS